MTSSKLEKGRLLIAEPSILNDDSFNRSIILLTEHSNRSSVGFILNKPLDYVLNDLMPEIPCDFTIYQGGPVEQDNLYFVHRVPQLLTDSIKVAEDIYWGGNFNQLKDLLSDNLLKSTDIRFFLGYSGWSREQLQNELDTTSWKIIENKHHNIFDISYKSFWKDELMKFGGEYQIWANAPENPSLN